MLKSKFMKGCFVVFLTMFNAAIFGQTQSVLVNGFGDGNIEFKNPKAVRTSKGAETISIDTSGAKPEWNGVLSTAEGLLKPDTEYVIRFKYRIEDGTPDNAFLHCIVRSANGAPAVPDIKKFDLKYAPDLKKVKQRFRTPASPADFTFQIHTHKGLKAEISGFSIAEGSADEFYPALENAPRYTAPLDNLPTGAKEFEVETPQNNGGAAIDAADFGTDRCDPSNFASALNAAIRKCKEMGASKLFLKKGVYRVTENAPIKFEGLKDFEFDAQGSTFVFLRTRGHSMTIANCERVKFANFNFDWDWEKDPLGSVVQIDSAKTDGDKPYIDLKFVEYDAFPKPDVRIAVLSSYDPKTQSVGIEGGLTKGFEFHKNENKPETEWMSPNILRLYGKKGELDRFKAGALFRAQHYYYDMHGILMDSNRNLTLENVNIYSCAGHGIVINGAQQYWQFLNVNINPPQGAKRRPITTTADHCHMANSKGFFKMINCTFRLGADDCLNIHDCTAFAVRYGDCAVKTDNAKSASTKIGDKIELRHGDYSPTNYLGEITNIETLDAKKGIHVISFKEKLPAQKFDGFILFNRKFDSRNIILRGCRFGDNRARGILILGRDVTIENCMFFHTEMGAIKIETGYTLNLWSEGFGADNIVIRNNTFESVNPADIKNFDRARDIYMGIYIKTDPSDEQTSYPILSNILIQGNTFKNSYGLIASINSTGNVTVADNVFINDEPRKEPFDYRACFAVSYSQNTRIVNNTYVKSPYVPSPGVYADKETVKSLTVAGNRVVDKTP